MRSHANAECHTSNDLLFRLAPEYLNRHGYEVVAQSADEVQDVQNSPAISIGPYLIITGQTSLLTTISVYSERGESRQRVRLLYMNAVAFRIWRAMSKGPLVVGWQKRPPNTALLAYGVPFSE
jgi:hypothetical protein